MKCSKARKLINDNIDNLLESGQVRKLENHLDGCAACRVFHSDMKSIIAGAKKLEALNPSDGLWSDIEREIHKRNRMARIQRKPLLPKFPLYSRSPVFAIGTLFGVLILIPLLFFVGPYLGDKNIDPGTPVLVNYNIAEQHYQSAIEALDQAISNQEKKLNPELLAVFKKNLAIIDDSIRICKKSIENSPDIRETNKLLLICYRKKIELLTEIKDITMQS